MKTSSEKYNILYGTSLTATANANNNFLLTSQFFDYFEELQQPLHNTTNSTNFDYNEIYDDKMENFTENGEGAEQFTFLSDDNFDEIFECEILNDRRVSIDPEQFISFDSSDFDRIGGESFEPTLSFSDMEEREEKGPKNQLQFCAETGVLQCKLGKFQHLQYLLPNHPLVANIKTKEWSRINDAVRKHFSKSDKNVAYLSVSPKEYSNIYKMIKETKFLKQRNSYFFIALDKKGKNSSFFFTIS